MEQLYLEPNEEITSVIDKVANASGGKVAVVVPKNSTLFQSLVNLKLLAKQAKESSKEVVIITGNKVGQRLASQVGIEAYATLGTVRDIAPSLTEAQVPTVAAVALPETLPDGTPIRRYVPPTGRQDAEQPTPVIENDPEPTQPPMIDSPSETIPVSEVGAVHETIEVTADEPEPTPDTIVETVIEKAPIAHRDPAPADELPAIVSRTPVAKPEFHFHVPWKSLAVAGVLLLIVFSITYLLLPKATVTVTLPAKAVSETLELSARTVSDQADATVSGNLLSVDKTLTKAVVATGKKNIGTKATGAISFKNCEDSDAHVIAAGTKVTASSKIFITGAAATIPAGSFSGGGTVCKSSSVTINVSADAAGEAHNLSNATFTIGALSTRISGAGSTTGGTTKQVTVLAQEDVDKVLAELEKQATDEATAEVTAKAEGQTLIDGALKQAIKQRSTDKKVGDQVDSATATLVTTVSAIVFDSTIVQTKITDALTKKIDSGQRLEIPQDKLPVVTFKEYSADKSVLVMTVTASGFGVADVSKPAIAQSIAHKSSASAESILKDKYQATETKIEITPSWWFDRLPMLKGAITVEYGFSEVANEPVPTP